jgi:hypothetical protein
MGDPGRDCGSYHHYRSNCDDSRNAALFSTEKHVVLRPKNSNVENSYVKAGVKL